MLISCSLVKTSAPATGEDLFKSDPFGSVSGASSKTTSSSTAQQTSSVLTVPPTVATTTHAVDPFSGQDPFHLDPFNTKDKQQVRKFIICHTQEYIPVVGMSLRNAVVV